MKLTKKKRGLSAQINLLIVLGMAVAGMITYFIQYKNTEKEIRENIGKQAAYAALETISAVKEYPSYEWLLSYWYENAERLDVEYDVGFEGGSETQKKRLLFSERYPGLQIRYMSREEVEALPEKDQKLFAEIAYSWILNRINETKRNMGCDFLFLTVTDMEESDHPYGSQCFLLSGAGPDSRRGTDYEDAYTLGVTVPVKKNSSTAGAMQNAVESASQEHPEHVKISSESLRDAGNYLDYYECLALIGNQAYLAGAAYNLKAMTYQIHARSLKTSLLGAVYQFMLLQLVMRHLLLYVIHPLKKILRSIRQYTETRNGRAAEQDMTEILSGKNSMAIRENEIGQLAEDFTDLALNMDYYVEQIRAVTSQKERYETELNIAAQIQEQVLPKALTVPAGDNPFDVYAMMTPAREVGGDFYDYFFIGQDHLVLAIGDVSDKGVPAALFMMIAKTLINNHAKMGESPSEIISHVNDQLSENNEAGYFVTVWLALIDLSTGKGVSVNAGHEHPVICRRGGSYELVRYRHNLAVGTMPGIRYREHEFLMSPGDKLFVYTDGVPEAVNKDHEQFGTDRMLEALNRNKDAGPRELLEYMKQEIDAFAGDVPQFDDTTMLYFYYKGENAAQFETDPKTAELAGKV